MTECIEAALLYLRVMAHNGNTSELTEELRVNYNLVQTDLVRQCRAQSWVTSPISSSVLRLALSKTRKIGTTGCYLGTVKMIDTGSAWAIWTTICILSDP